MKAAKRPLSVVIVSCLYIAVGAIGFVVNFPKLIGLQSDSAWVELTELLAVASGAFMLRRQNWARWLALTWMAFHVAVSFPVFRQVAIHSLFLILVIWALFHYDARRYFAAPEEHTK